MLQAIRTNYRGIPFRSRLEARWAVFFDSLKIPWVYEPEGFVLDGVCYMPDFYLPDCKQFFEVKGVLTDKDNEKIHKLIDSGYSVTIGYDNGKFDACDNWSQPDGPKFELSNGGILCKCLSCGKYWFMGDSGCYVCQCCGEYDGDHHFVNVMEYYAGEHFVIEDTTLWDVARQARFEFGETPTI